MIKSGLERRPPRVQSLVWARLSTAADSLDLLQEQLETQSGPFVAKEGVPDFNPFLKYVCPELKSLVGILSMFAVLGCELALLCPCYDSAAQCPLKRC